VALLLVRMHCYVSWKQFEVASFVNSNPVADPSLSPTLATVIDGYKYAKSHEWAKVDGDVATVGISDHAQVGLRFWGVGVFSLNAH
jgi:hypothetical protein